MSISSTARPIDVREHPFYGRRAVIVTKHGKERVLIPILHDRLRMFGEVLIIDTDVFGTFTGEVERQGSQLDALRSKLQSGAELTPYDAILVANEGSFSPDPSFPFITLNRELVGMYDPVNALEIIGSGWSNTTNMTSIRVSSIREIESALGSIMFPSHAVIVRSQAGIAKGIRDRNQLFDLVEAIGDQKDQAAPAHLVGDVVQQRPDGVLVARLDRHQRVKDRLHVPELAARRQAIAPSLVEHVEGHAVALMDDEIRQHGG